MARRIWGTPARLLQDLTKAKAAAAAAEAAAKKWRAELDALAAGRSSLGNAKRVGSHADAAITAYISERDAAGADRAETQALRDELFQLRADIKTAEQAQKPALPPPSSAQPRSAIETLSERRPRMIDRFAEEQLSWAQVAAAAAALSALDEWDREIASLADGRTSLGNYKRVRDRSEKALVAGSMIAGVKGSKIKSALGQLRREGAAAEKVWARLAEQKRRDEERRKRMQATKAETIGDLQRSPLI